MIDLPKQFSKPCIKRLEKSGLDTLIRNECNKNNSFKSYFDYFNLEKNSPWEYGGDNISPCETIMFTACRSIQNIQYLIVLGGSFKYCCKYVGNIDKKLLHSVYILW